MQSKDRIHAELSVDQKIGDDDDKHPGKPASMKASIIRRNGVHMYTQFFPWPRAVQIL